MVLSFAARNNWQRISYREASKNLENQLTSGTKLLASLSWPRAMNSVSRTLVLILKSKLLVLYPLWVWLGTVSVWTGLCSRDLHNVPYQMPNQDSNSKCYVASSLVQVTPVIQIHISQVVIQDFTYSSQRNIHHLGNNQFLST